MVSVCASQETGTNQTHGPLSLSFRIGYVTAFSQMPGFVVFSLLPTD